MSYEPEESINKLKQLIDFCEEYQYSILGCNILNNEARVLVNECCDTLDLIYNKRWEVEKNK